MPSPNPKLCPEDLTPLFSQVATANSSEYLAHLGMVMTPALDITG